MSSLEFRNLTVTFGRGEKTVVAVDAVSLVVPDRTVVGLVGESGSGKSTLARAAVGLVDARSGDILVDGQPATTGRRRRGGLQMVFQDPYSSLDPRMSIGASIAEALPSDVRRAERRGAVAELLEQVGLDPLLAPRMPSGLSGGQRQRIALARALAAEPAVLIADEITSALDVSVQGQVLNLLREVQRGLAMSVLFISHNLATVCYLSDIVAVMERGRIVEIGPTEQIVADPQHPYTRELLESAPRLGEKIDPEQLAVPD
ncbi:ABC transporter ATP-binding protein, partial [Nakamurella lactea]|uniref:ABC transporter ATP-binding protein n=1 Tax=Nakamurella lactea TaxID=459515 RepID=UPI0003F5851F